MMSDTFLNIRINPNLISYEELVETFASNFKQGIKKIQEKQQIIGDKTNIAFKNGKIFADFSTIPQYWEILEN